MGAVKQVAALAVLGRRRGTDVESLPSGNLRKVTVTWLSEDYFCYRVEVSAVARYCSKFRRHRRVMQVYPLRLPTTW